MLLGQLDGSTSQLSLVNLGDSAAMVLRPSPRRFARVGTILWPRLVARTQEQTHYFNCPYQVGSEDMSRTVREGSPDEIQVTLTLTLTTLALALALTLTRTLSLTRCVRGRATSSSRRPTAW